MEHKLIQGGEQYLPFARSRIKALKATGLKYASQKFEIDGVSIRVRIAGEHEYIEIEGGAGGYEYLSADAGYGSTVNGAGIPGAVSSIYPGATFITGSAVRLPPAGRAKPVYAQTLEDTADPKRWPKATIEDVITRGNLTGDVLPGTFFTFASRPNVQFQTYHWWYNNDPKQLVTSVCATGNGRSWTDRNGRPYSASYDITDRIDAESEFGYSLSNMRVEATGTTRYMGFTPVDFSNGASTPFASAFLFATFWPQNVYLRASPIVISYDKITYFYVDSGAYNPDPSAVRDTRFIREFAWSVRNGAGASFVRVTPATYYEAPRMFDVAPTSYTRDAIFYGGTKRTEEANWRHAALHVATDAEGKKHRFIVSTDTHGVFTFYREKNYNGLGYDARNIPAGLTKVVRVDYPDWVTVTPDDVSCTDDHWQWAFNKTATRACSTPLNHQDLYLYLGTVELPNASVLGTYVGVQTLTGRYTLMNFAEHFVNVAGFYTFRGFTSSERLKIYKLKKGSTYKGAEVLERSQSDNSAPYLVAAEFRGKLVPISVLGPAYTTRSFQSEPGLRREEFEPEKNTTPGFVEVDISVAITGPGDMDFEPSVTVRQSEQYADNSTFFMDCAYYIKTPRSKTNNPAAIEPEDDELLTGEIEVFCGEPSSQGLGEPYAFSSVPDVAAAASGVEGTVRGQTRLHNAYAFYTVRRRSDKAVVKRLALTRGASFAPLFLNDEDYLYDPITPCFYGAVEQADLRFLSFMTVSYSRRKLPPTPYIMRRAEYDTALAGAPDPVYFLRDERTRVTRLPHFLRPRFELRVHGEALRTVDYSRPEVTGFTPEYDPMTDGSLPAGVEDRSNQSNVKSALLLFKHHLANNQFQITNNDTFSFSPDGSWSVYADRRSTNMVIRPDMINPSAGDMPMHPDSTEMTGVFDVIKKKSGKATTHKDEFNKAFGQGRDYDFYDPDAGDVGGFGRCGIWYKR